MARILLYGFALLGVFGLFSSDALLAAARGEESADSPKWEVKAVKFGSDETENTKKLNDLTVEGWEYVGPLNGSMVAFKRSKAVATELAGKKELDKLNGTWVLVAAEAEGEQAPAEKLKGLKVVIRDGKVAGFDSAGDKISTLTMKMIDAASDPRKIDMVTERDSKQLDLTDLLEGNVTYAIYRLDGDILKIIGCRSKNAEADRPTEFSTKKGDNREMMTLKRTKE
jgi:uncharacterized protein (TIGR03067 family)